MLTHYPDGISRHEALRRLLATTEPPVRLWSPSLWVSRLRASWAVLRAFWRERRA
jgi:hypothetical protein